jgi:catechol-2,3-dioxygenase
MSVTATLTVSAARTRSTTAAFTAFNTQLTIGTKVTLDPYYQLVVARELSVKKIQQETGILTVDAENRLNTVQAENATLYVPSETSIYHIPYSLQVGPRRVK